MNNFEFDKEAKHLVDTTTHYGLARDYVILLHKSKEESLYEQNTPIPLGATHQSACGVYFYYVLDGTVDAWDDVSEQWVDSNVHPDDLIRM